MNADRDRIETPTVPQFHQLKANLHRAVLDRLNLESLQRADRETAEEGIRVLITELMSKQATPLSTTERRLIIEEILNEIFGLGPLEPLLADPKINDILVNSHKQIFVERQGHLELTPVTFKDDNHLMQIIDRIVSRVGRRIDESSPMVDARLLDGSRINAIIPPLAIDGPHLSIRKFRKDTLTGDDLIRYGSISTPILELLAACVKARLNILVSGGTGAGKTTLLNIFSAFVPESERVVVIEDSAELQLRQEHVVRLETRPPNIEGEGQVTQRQLVINSLRMRPDRIIIGEVRAGEAIDMLQAMNTGHDGSLTTIHASAPRDALSRLETMVAMGGLQLPAKTVKENIASALDVVVQVARHADGVRRVTSLSEITGMEESVITMQEIFKFEKHGIDAEGNVVGRYCATGIRPRFSDRLRVCGIEFPMNMFEEPMPTEDIGF